MGTKFNRRLRQGTTFLAEACSEAVTRPTVRFVPIKTDDQRDLQSLHRVRERWVVRRTAVINQIRGMLLERGITIRKGLHWGLSPQYLEDADNKLSGALRVTSYPTAVGELEMRYLHGQIGWIYDHLLPHAEAVKVARARHLKTWWPHPEESIERCEAGPRMLPYQGGELLP